MEGADRATRAGLRVVVAEDSALLREGLVRLLAEEGHTVVAAVEDAPSLVQAVRESSPDIVVVDVRMPPSHTSDGLQVAVQIRRERPGVGVLVLSQYVEREYATQLFTENTYAVGYLLKDRVGPRPSRRGFPSATEEPRRPCTPDQNAHPGPGVHGHRGNNA